MPQLALFEGPHVPRKAAHEALARGDLDGARAQLERLADAAEEAADAARLERIATRLRARGADPTAVHDAFAAALAAPGPPGFLSEADWQMLYAQRLAAALAPRPGGRFRGWLGAHFAFAGGVPDEARRAAGRIVESEPPGPAWIEAARLAFELGQAAQARAWIHAACLASPVELAPEAPALEPCGVPALDTAPALPPLPPPVEDAFDAARALEDLPGLRTRWVAVVGEIDRVLAPLPGPGESGADAPRTDGPGTHGPRPDASAPTRPASVESAETADTADAPDHPARAFLAALRAARRSRERDRPQGPDRCSDRELRARRRMQRLAPALLERYLRSMRGELL